jgi:hypothetical protein
LSTLCLPAKWGEVTRDRCQVTCDLKAESPLQAIDTRRINCYFCRKPNNGGYHTKPRLRAEALQRTGTKITK